MPVTHLPDAAKIAGHGVAAPSVAPETVSATKASTLSGPTRSIVSSSSPASAATVSVRRRA